MGSDPDIAKSGCTSGCGPTGEETNYNWGITSNNVSLNQASAPSPSPSASTPAASSCPGDQYTACSGDTCGFYNPQSNSCSVYFCSTSCDGGCTINHVIIPNKQCNP